MFFSPGGPGWSPGFVRRPSSHTDLAGGRPHMQVSSTPRVGRGWSPHPGSRENGAGTPPVSGPGPEVYTLLLLCPLCQNSPPGHRPGHRWLGCYGLSAAELASGAAPVSRPCVCHSRACPGPPGHGAPGGTGLQIDAQPMPGLVPGSVHVACCLEDAPSWWPFLSPI